MFLDTVLVKAYCLRVFDIQFMFLLRGTQITLTGNKKLDRLVLLEDKLNQAREEVEGKPKKKIAPEQNIGHGLGFAMKIGVELVSAVIVGTGIGLILDNWLATTPWLMLTFFLLGSVAGIMNVYRSVNGFGNTVGFHPVSNLKDDSCKGLKK